jgi:hypothetical protein
MYHLCFIDVRLVLPHYRNCCLFWMLILSIKEARLYRENNQRLQSPESAGNPIALCVLVQDWARGTRILDAAQTLLPGFLDLQFGDRSTNFWSRLAWSGLVAEHNNDFMTAFSRLLLAAEMAESRRRQSTDSDSRRDSFNVLAIGDIFAGLVRICLVHSTLNINCCDWRPCS